MRTLPADPALEGLEELFPAEGAPEFVAVAAAEMFDEPVDPLGGRVVHVRYWPGEGCVLAWSFPGRDGSYRLVSGRLFAGEHGARVVERSSFRRRVRRAQSESGAPPFRFLADRRLLLLAFPMDGRLSGLPAASSERWLRSVLCPALGLVPASVGRIARRPLSFKPWRRCVFRYEMELPDGPFGCFAKVFRDDRGEVLFERVEAIRQGLKRTGAHWETPRALAYLPAEKLLVLEEFAGALEVRDLLHEARRDDRARSRLIESLTRAGEAVGDLRTLEIEGLPTMGPAELLAGVRKRTRGLEGVAPDLAETFAGELARLDREAECLPPELLVPAHGALRHDQLLFRDGRLGVLDLDGVCLAGASADAGHFLGFLDMVAVRRPRLRELLAECEEAFLTGLRERGGASPAWLDWYRAAARLKKTVRTFLSLDRKWPESVAALRRARAAAVSSRGTG